MKRKIVLDTETTGLNLDLGDRMVEIGAVELINNIKTGREFHVYMNPQHSIHPEAFAVHGLSEQFLSDKPLFKDVADDFIRFIKGCDELLIHNAKFDIGFLNKELDSINKGKIWDYVKQVVCTLQLDKRLFPKERKHKLDDMCARFGIDISQRKEKGHGGLLDSHLLADCYLKINEIHSTEDIEADLEQTHWVRPAIKRFDSIVLPSIKLSAREEVMHQEFLASMATKDKVTPLFDKPRETKGMRL